MSALAPIPQDCVTHGNLTPAMRQWMLNALVDAIGFDNAIIALQASRMPFNVLANGGFSVWQRGTSFPVGAVSSAVTADRWRAGRQGAIAGLTVTRQAGPSGYQYCARVQRDSGNATAGADPIFGQCLETVDSIPFAGMAVTLSFMARVGADFSGSNLRAAVTCGTGTDQNFFTGYTGAVNAVNQGVTPTTSWQSFSVTGTVPTNITEITPSFAWTPTGTAGAADYFEIAAVQLEVGSVASIFQRRSFAEQLMRCQRYYQKSFSYATVPASGLNNFNGTLQRLAIAAGAVGAWCYLPFATRLRAAPTMTYYNPGTVANSNWWNGFTGVQSGLASTLTNGETAITVQHQQATADAVGQTFNIHWTADAEL